MKGNLVFYIGSLFLTAPLTTLAQRVPVKQLDDSVKIRPDGNTVTWKEPGQPGREQWGCDPADGEYLALTPDLKYATCCAEGQALKGSADTEFHCGGAGHDLAGDADVGYQCCPDGHPFDGTVCRQNCANGKELDADGNCVCPAGQIEDPEGICVDMAGGEAAPAGGCKSGLETGKCYIFKGVETGRRLAWKNTQYSEAVIEKGIIPGKFQLCRDQACIPGLPLNPSQTLYIKDLHGAAPTSQQHADFKIPGQWLNLASNGAHITKTKEFSKAGKFSITKWSCGTYFLTGVPNGLGMACPATDPSFTFYDSSPEACVEFELIEVPC